MGRCLALSTARLLSATEFVSLLLIMSAHHCWHESVRLRSRLSATLGIAARLRMANVIRLTFKNRASSDQKCYPPLSFLQTWRTLSKTVHCLSSDSSTPDVSTCPHVVLTCLANAMIHLPESFFRRPSIPPPSVTILLPVSSSFRSDASYMSTSSSFNISNVSLSFDLHSMSC